MKSRAPAHRAHEAGLAHAARRPGEDRPDGQPPRRRRWSSCRRSSPRSARRGRSPPRAAAPRGSRGTRPSAAGDTRSAPSSRSARTRGTPATTSAEHDTGRPGARLFAMSAIRRSCAGLRYAWSRQTAIASAPRASAPSSARSTDVAMSSGTSTEPSAFKRSVTSNRRARSTTGLGRTNVGTKSAGILRFVRPISIRSRKPGGGQDRDARAAPLEDGVGADGGAVHDAPDLTARDAERREPGSAAPPLRCAARTAPW